MFDVRNDLRGALRYARRHPAFAVAVTTTLSLSIAAATTAFGLATAVLWRPLPFRDGMYGRLAVLVGGRTRAIGVRLAIGAPPAAVARQVVRDSLGNDVAGVAIGSVLALAAGSLLQSLLVGVSARDPATLATVAALLIAVAAAAAFLPGRRARIDPVTALRSE